MHSHVLPFIDDGSDSLQTSVSMVENQARQGVTDIILTPHYRDVFQPTREQIENSLEQLKQALEEKGVRVNLYLGQEIYVGRDIKSVLTEKKALTMNDTNYVLVEFEVNYKRDIPEMIYELKLMGYKPIVAHLERYYYVNLDTAIAIKEMGGLIQVNAASIVGKHKGHFAKIVKGLFKNGLVDFVASDLHANRENFMEKSYKYVCKKYGQSVANAVFSENAKQIING